MRKHPFFRRHPGEGTPMILAIVLVLLMLFCTVAEFSRVWIIAQGVKEAAQQAVISTINDNYDDVYHAVREGYLDSKAVPAPKPKRTAKSAAPKTPNSEPKAMAAVVKEGN